MAIGKGIRSILINGAYLVGSNWIEIILRAVYVVAITRTLGPEHYGIWAYVMATYIFAMSGAAFGLEALVGIALGRSSKTAGSDMASVLVLRIVTLCLAAVGLGIFAQFASALPNVGTALLLVIPALFARSISELIRAMFTGLEQAGTHLRIRGALRALEVAVGIALLSFGAGLFTLLILHAVTWVIEAIICVLALRDRLETPLRDPSRLAMMHYMRKGTPLGIAVLLSGWMTAAPLLLYAPLAPDGDTFGAFSLAMQLAMILVGSILGFFGAALPIMSRSMAANDARAQNYAPLSAMLSFGLCALAAVLAIIIGPQLIDWVFGSDFALTGTLLAPVAVLTGAIILPTGYGQHNLVRGLIWPSILGGALGGLVLYLVFSPLVSAYGPHGAIYAAGIGWLIRAVVIIGASFWSKDKETLA